MQISAAMNSTTFSAAFEGLTLNYGTGKAVPIPYQGEDRVELSDSAISSSRSAAITSMDAEESSQGIDFLRGILKLMTGQDVEELQAKPDGEEAAESESFQPPDATDAFSASADYQETTLSAEQASLSVSGAITTKDGKELAFSLDLQYQHASLAAQSLQAQASPDGLSLRYSGLAAELTSTSFSFTLAGSDSFAATKGSGILKLNDELGQVGKAVKSLVKEFSDYPGFSGEWGMVNRFIRSIA